jgi:chaperonin GroEL (HSP60 family)
MSAIQTTSEGIPVIILKECSKQSRDRDTQKNNINATKLIVEIIASSLGPQGMDKMLVDSISDIQLRARQSAGEEYAGVDVIDGVIGDIEKIDVLELIKVKEQVIQLAIETANMILRIDNVVTVSRTSLLPGQMPNQPTGMY